MPNLLGTSDLGENHAPVTRMRVKHGRLGGINSASPHCFSILPEQNLAPRRCANAPLLQLVQESDLTLVGRVKNPDYHAQNIHWRAARGG
jgi:hypothetical protein